MGSMQLQVWVCLKTPQNSQFPEVRPFFFGRILLLTYICTHHFACTNQMLLTSKQTERTKIFTFDPTPYTMHGCMKTLIWESMKCIQFCFFDSFKLHEGSTKHQRANQKRQSIQIHKATYPKVTWSMILNNSSQKTTIFIQFQHAILPQVSTFIQKTVPWFPAIFVKPPHKESKLWSDASVSVSQANNLFFVDHLSQGCNMIGAIK